MNAAQFPTNVAAVGVFEVFESSPGWNACYIKATIPENDVVTSIKVTKALVDMQLHFLMPICRAVNVSVRIRKTVLRGTKRGFLEHEVILYVKSPAVVNWLSANTNIVAVKPAKQMFQTDKLSVGPCVFIDKSGSGKYAHVRFDGVSVPFYFTSKFDESATNAAILGEFGVATTDDIMSILRSYSKIIMGRVKDRPLNLSGVPESSEHRIVYYEEIENGLYRRLSKDNMARLSDPKFIPILVFSYGGSYGTGKWASNDFTYVNDVLYRIAGFYNPEYNYNYGLAPKKKQADYNKTITNYQSDDAMFKFVDCIPIHESDQFIREKIARALKLKL